MLSMRLSRQLGGTLSQPLMRPRPCLHTRRPHGLVPAASAPGNRRHMHLIQATVETTQSLIVSLHTLTGTPWYATIPLVALAVSLARLPFTVHAQSLVRRRVALTPLVQSWLATHARVGDGAAATRERYEATKKRIIRDHGLQGWKLNYNLLVFPVWLTAIEAIRRLCGGPTGLLGAMFFKGNDAAAAAAVTAGEQLQGVEMVSTAASGVASLGLETTTVVAEGGLPDTAAAATAAATSGSFEPSLATGGALWFPDLTVADPYHILPMMLSAVMVYHFLPKTTAGRRDMFSLDDRNPNSKSWRTRLTRALVVVAVSIGPATMDMPAAIHLYWLCSTSLAVVSERLVALALPLPKHIPKCKGSERMLIMPRRPS